MLCNKRTENENATNIEKIYDKKTIEYYNKGTSELLRACWSGFKFTEFCRIFSSNICNKLVNRKHSDFKEEYLQ